MLTATTCVLLFYRYHSSQLLFVSARKIQHKTHHKMPSGIILYTRSLLWEIPQPPLEYTVPTFTELELSHTQKKTTKQTQHCRCTNRGHKPLVVMQYDVHENDVLLLAMKTSTAVFCSRWHLEKTARISLNIHFPCRPSVYAKTWAGTHFMALSNSVGLSYLKGELKSNNESPLSPPPELHHTKCTFIRMTCTWNQLF